MRVCRPRIRRQNIGHVISISAICSYMYVCTHMYVYVYLYVQVYVCMYGWVAQTNWAVCGFIRVCVVGAKRIRSHSFYPSGMRPTGRPGVACIQIHVYTCIHRQYTLQRMKFAGAISAWRPTTSPNKETFPSTGKKRRCDRSELVVTNVPRQNSRPQILPEKRGHFLLFVESAPLFKQL